MNLSAVTWLGVAVFGFFLINILFAFVLTLEQFPLLPSFLKLIGVSYTGWFIYRYLLTQEKRQNLREIINNTKAELVGDTSISQASIEQQKTLINPELEQEFELIFGAIYTIRNLRAEAGIKPGMKVDVILQSENSQEREILSKGKTYIQDLGKVENLTVTAAVEEDKQQQVIAGVVGTVQVLIPLAGLVDVEVLRNKLEKNLDKIEGEIKSLQGRLSNEKFISKAPEEVVQGAKDALAEAEKQQSILKDRLEKL
uniref:CAAD domain-containing protein n=1 Tax=Dactylococcopsis salina TaxID=292566 RepID=UPI0038BD04AE